MPISWFFISETKCVDPMSFSAYAKLSYQLLKSKALFYVVLYQFLTSMIGQISTTAGGMVKNYWAGVKNLQSQIFMMIGHIPFHLGQISAWRRVAAATVEHVPNKEVEALLLLPRWRLLQRSRWHSLTCLPTSLTRLPGLLCCAARNLSNSDLVFVCLAPLCAALSRAVP